MIVRADRCAVIRHRRAGDGGIETRLIVNGATLLDPPGIWIEMEDFCTP